MDPKQIAEAFFFICLALAMLVPVVGITARIALKPIMEVIVRLREGQTSSQSHALVERRLDVLEREVQSLTGMREEIDRLREAQEFQLRLAGEKEGIRSLEAGQG